ncbi:hypothetical protein QE441_001600 [Chryseobacterium sp. SORGH_AS909]|uniref:hypothetical protein n=1 Tax=Chryseobacterium sp. SORGH_AS_0909 TaxID=3041759 RepID=UPI0028675437|nr:hypothetical protein [Chryseobacterium sp. SORGH_AS_0909]MDR6085806.1 hypothetical protein [Chryseobacterium sp. SORGH_AS_0909]
MKHAVSKRIPEWTAAKKISRTSIIPSIKTASRSLPPVMTAAVLPVQYAILFIETPFSVNQKLELSYYKSNKNLQFQYSDPYLSDRLKEIWQPPKLG